jgi:nicotinamide mononucleotide transporter
LKKRLNLTHLVFVCIAAIAIGLWLKQRFQGDWFEFAGFTTGVVGVYLVAVEHIINWPVGLLNVSIYGYFFYKGNLLADMSLQIFFFALGVQGWYHWSKGGQQKSELSISKLSLISWIGVIVAFLAGTAIYYPIINHFKGSFPLIDTSLTVASIIAQLLLNAKKIENWFIWIIADIAYIQLYISKQFYSTAYLYGLFLVLAIFGLMNWTKTYKSSMKPKSTTVVYPREPV